MLMKTFNPKKLRHAKNHLYFGNFKTFKEEFSKKVPEISKYNI